jgi:hypothetical protein
LMKNSGSPRGTQQVPPLRFASVGMTKGRVAGQKGFLRLEVYFLAVKSKTLHVVEEGLAVFVTFGSLALFLVAVQGR